MSFHSIESLPVGDQLLFNRFGRGRTVRLAYRTVTSAFDAILSTCPPSQAAAVECFGTERTITYAELDRRSNMIANHLIRTGLQPRERVACVYSRSIEMCVFILGVLKAGAQYVPIDGAVMVEDGLRHVLADCAPKIVLCMPDFLSKVEASVLPNAKANIVAVGASDPLWATGDARHPNIPVHPEDGAYIIYTSGTTGKPKGVDVGHEGTCNTLLNEPARLGITKGTTVACLLMVGFDMCAWSILGTFLNGGTLNIRGTSQGGDREVWRSCLERSDVVIITPSGGQKYLPRRAEFPNIKTIAVGGEPCPLSLADEWAPHVRFWNVCGPTEISILNTAHPYRPATGTPLSIGSPNPNTTLYILDQDQNPVRIGEPGLMWVGGLGVSRGYLNLPDLTDRAYQLDKFTQDGRRMFNTGDLGRWLENGEVEHLGRRDDQVKINGCRVELDGVSASIEQLSGHDSWIEKACALKIGDELWGFYSVAGTTCISEDALRRHLQVSLNYYAQPSRLVHMDNMPLTPVGKIDKRALERLAVDTNRSEAASRPSMYAGGAEISLRVAIKSHLAPNGNAPH